MKKIGTITFHESINYGAILQTYALQKYLVDQGYNSEVIDYRNSKRGLEHLTMSRKVIHHIWNKVIKKVLIGETRQKKTSKFVTDNIPISKMSFSESTILHNTPPLYDAYITGSDQVWNPKNTSGDSSYFLTFAPLEKLKISYAPSFGVSLLDDKYKKKYKDWLSRIDRLSVREKEGKAIIHDITGEDTIITLDPTLLLEQKDWEKVSIPYYNKRPYVLCYHMPGDKIVNSAISKIAKKIAKKNNWDVISIGQKEYMKLIPGGKRIFNAGPDEYVGLFQNASFVLTNSFHGTVFSIIFNKNFYVPINEKLPTDQVLSSRISSLLSILNIEDRLIPANIKFDLADDKNIDYTEVNNILHKSRTDSRLFLEDALSSL